MSELETLKERIFEIKELFDNFLHLWDIDFQRVGTERERILLDIQESLENIDN